MLCLSDTSDKRVNITHRSISVQRTHILSFDFTACNWSDGVAIGTTPAAALVLYLFFLFFFLLLSFACVRRSPAKHYILVDVVALSVCSTCDSFNVDHHHHRFVNAHVFYDVVDYVYALACACIGFLANRNEREKRRKTITAKQREKEKNHT